MDHDEALDLLPPLYAVALRLADAGAEPALIAAAAGIEPESVAPFVELGRAKLAELTQSALSAEPAVVDVGDEREARARGDETRAAIRHER